MTENATGRLRTRVGAYGLCLQNGRVLLTLLAIDDPEGGLWTLPGGGINWGESTTEALVREFWEETGLAPAIGPLLGVDSKVYRTEDYPGMIPTHAIRLIYRTDIEGQPTVMEEDGSTVEAAWWPETALPRCVDLVTIALDLVRTR